MYTRKFGIPLVVISALCVSFVVFVVRFGWLTHDESHFTTEKPATNKLLEEELNLLNEKVMILEKKLRVEKRLSVEANVTHGKLKEKEKYDAIFAGMKGERSTSAK